MRAKVFAATLFIMAIAFATNSTSSLMNSSVSLGFGDCLNLTSTDGNNSTSFALVCAPAFPQVNLNQSLEYGGVFTNSSLNLTVMAPAFPRVNQNRTLGYGEVYENTSLNLSLTAPNATGCPTLSINRNLNCGETFTYSNGTTAIVVTTQCHAPNLNLTASTQAVSTALYGGIITCNAAPRNVNVTPDFGGTWSDAYYGINVSCPQFPRLNQNVVLGFGQTVSSTQTDNRFNYSFTCPYTTQTCNDVSSQLSNCMQTKTTMQESNTDLSTQNTQLSAQLTQVRAQAAECSKNTTVSNGITGFMNCSTSAQIVCPDNFMTTCKPEEILQGGPGYSACMKRVQEEANATCSSRIVDYAKCTGDLETCKTGQKTSQDFADTLLTLVGGGIVLLGGSVLAAMYFMNKKKRDEG